ncbi:MAG: c-type cytochrome [Comamonas sp.]
MSVKPFTAVPGALGVALALLCGSSMAASNAGPDQRLQTQQWAANCAACHGTDGRAVQGSTVPGLAGVPAATMVEQLQAFKNGKRPATVMHQIAKGLSDAQIKAMADYFAAQKP